MHLSTALSLLAVASVSSAQNITSLLASTSELSSLLALLGGYPDLVETLSQAHNVTVFAPNNAALNAVSSSGALAKLNSSLPDFVPNLISYHVLDEVVYASQISNTPAFPPSLLTSSAYTNVTGGQVVEARLNGSGVTLTSGLKNTANVVTANVNFTGGVVHIIDSVLTIPPTISTTLSDGGLSGLEGALGAAGLTATLDSLKDVTVFAPSNAAFQAIGSALGSLSVAQLTSILGAHVVNGTIAYSSTLSNTTVTTLGGAKVQISVRPDGAVYVNQARVTNPDILVANGVVHVIDSVLNPNVTTGTAFPGASSVSNLGALTSSLPSPSTTVPALTTSLAAVASGGPSAKSTSATGTTSTGGAMPMATAALAGAMALGGMAALVVQM